MGKTAHTRSRPFAFAGLLAMVVGALLVLAPAAGAEEEEKVEDANNTAKFLIVFDEETGVAFDDKGTEATEDDTTSFTYTLERDPVAENDEDNMLSHMSVDFCTEPATVSPPFTLDEGNKWDDSKDVANGQEYVIEFLGDWTGAIDLETGSTWTMKKGTDERPVSSAGPDCTPGEDPDPANLTIVKVVTGDDAPEEWSFPFTVNDGQEFDLTNETEDSDTASEEVAAGSYTIAEEDSGDATLVSIDCGDAGDGDPTTGSVTVELEAGDDVTCTFTNDFPDVDDSEVPRDPDPTEKPKPTVTPKVTPPAPATEVLGVSVKRTLPATGSSSQTLGFAGLGMLVLGAGLVASTRRMAH